MGRYSSDSDSDRNSRKSRKDRKSNRRKYSRSTSSSSDSSTSHSRKNYNNKSRRHRSSSTERRRSDRDRHSKYRHDNKKSRHRRSRSRSRSYITEFTSTSRRSSSSSSNSGASFKKTAIKESVKQTAVLKSKAELEPTLTVSKPNSIEVVKVSEEVLNELNQDAFEPKEFTSKVNETILIDLQKQTIKIPQAEVKASETENIFHHNLFQPGEVRVLKWLKELYSYRHRALQTGGTKQ
ncbi:DNA topoisomerase 1-like [Atheta coriaria]|uniref:DNA topoisomerase 1-like n=1 Tax=Dalotia coriaria TaxID=877792 RepID=UPI0031F3E1FD